MKIYEKLLLENKAWASEKVQDDPEYFSRLADIQKPDFLWIGCSDSRVPANEITNTQPGEIFVHRNIANVVVHTDLNCLSVIQFAVEVLKIKHIIVCGHYGCGGIKAAMGNQEHGLIDNWLRHIKDVYHNHRTRIESYDSDVSKFNLLCELNVVEQVSNVCHTTIVQNAWKSGQELAVHGWIYAIETGLLKDLDTCITNKDEISKIHQIEQFVLG